MTRPAQAPDPDYAADVARNRAAFPLTAGMPVNILACAFWPFRPAEPAIRITSHGPANVVLIRTAATRPPPLAGALRMRAAFGQRAVIVVADSGGHHAYLDNGNACGDAAVTRYLATGARPHGTFCR